MSFRTLDDLKKESELKKNTLFTYFRNVEKSKESGQIVEEIEADDSPKRDD